MKINLENPISKIFFFPGSWKSRRATSGHSTSPRRRLWATRRTKSWRTGARDCKPTYGGSWISWSPPTRHCPPSRTRKTSSYSCRSSRNMRACQQRIASSSSNRAATTVPPRDTPGARAEVRAREGPSSIVGGATTNSLQSPRNWLCRSQKENFLES